MYMRKCENISPYMKRPLVIYDFATAPFRISQYMRKIWFSFLSVCSRKSPDHGLWIVQVAWGVRKVQGHTRRLSHLETKVVDTSLQNCWGRTPSIPVFKTNGHLWIRGIDSADRAFQQHPHPHLVPTILFYRISSFRTESYNSVCKYFVDIWEWGLAKSFWNYTKIENKLFAVWQVLGSTLADSSLSYSDEENVKILYTAVCSKSQKSHPILKTKRKTKHCCLCGQVGI